MAVSRRAAGSAPRARAGHQRLGESRAAPSPSAEPGRRSGVPPSPAPAGERPAAAAGGQGRRGEAPQAPQAAARARPRRGGASGPRPRRGLSAARAGGGALPLLLLLLPPGRACGDGEGGTEGARPLCGGRRPGPGLRARGCPFVGPARPGRALCERSGAAKVSGGRGAARGLRARPRRCGKRPREEPGPAAPPRLQPGGAVPPAQLNGGGAAAPAPAPPRVTPGWETIAFVGQRGGEGSSGTAPALRSRPFRLLPPHVLLVKLRRVPAVCSGSASSSLGERCRPSVTSRLLMR